MAKELETQKDSQNESDKKSDAKAKDKKDKKDGKDNKDKGAKAKKRGPIKYLKDARAEFKKVVWPTPKETTHNTIVVLLMCGFAALFVFGMDSLFGLLNGLLFK